MSDTAESSRQATHAKQEGVDDNVAALAGPVVDTDGAGISTAATSDGSPAAAAPVASAAPPPGANWSSAVNAAPASDEHAPSDKSRGESPAKWIAAAGIGSAALVAALLYANRGKREDTSRGSTPGGDR